MAYSTIKDPSAYFQTVIWTGNNGSNVNVVNDGNSDLQPDFIWAKERTSPGGYDYNHNWVDSSRGVTKTLWSDSTAAEMTASQSSYDLQSFNTDGFTTGAPEYTNSLGGSAVTDGKVAWQWKANGGTTTSVSASGTGSGCVNACTYQANTTAGFSIITYTGRDDQLSNGQESKLTHGLGVAPDATIMKRRDSTGDWYVMGAFGGANGYPYSNNQFSKLNGTESVNGNYYVGDTAPDATHIFLGNALVNIASATYVCYAFAEKQGYSKFGKYVGRSHVDGPFVYLGFKPAFVMIKRVPAGTTYSSWAMFDNKRLGYNPTGGPQSLYANRNYAEGKRGQGSANSAEVRIDMVSNGFKVKDGGSDEINDVGDTYIYMAFAENPFVAGGVPTTAR